MIEFARFWSCIEIRGLHECWEWAGSRDQHGYGVPDAGICIAFQEPLAHRIACGMMRTRLDRQDFVLHSCDNAPCCNPRHLRWGDAFENADDRRIAEWAPIARGAQQGDADVPCFDATGKPWIVKKPDLKAPIHFMRGQSRLDDELVRQIRADHDAGMSSREIGVKYGLTQSHADSVAKRRIWKHIA